MKPVADPTDFPVVDGSEMVDIHFGAEKACCCLLDRRLFTSTARRGWVEMEVKAWAGEKIEGGDASDPASRAAAV